MDQINLKINFYSNYLKNKYLFYFNELSKNLSNIELAYNILKNTKTKKKHQLIEPTFLDGLSASEIIFNYLKNILDCKMNINVMKESLYYNYLNPYVKNLPLTIENSVYKYISLSFRDKNTRSKSIRILMKLINIINLINYIILYINNHSVDIKYIDYKNKNIFIGFNKDINSLIKLLNQELYKYLPNNIPYLTFYIPYFDDYLLDNIKRESNFLITKELLLCNKLSYEIFITIFDKKIFQKPNIQLIKSKIDINSLLNNFILKCCKTKLFHNIQISYLNLMD